MAEEARVRIVIDPKQAKETAQSLERRFPMFRRVRRDVVTPGLFVGGGASSGGIAGKQGRDNTAGAKKRNRSLGFVDEFLSGFSQGSGHDVRRPSMRTKKKPPPAGRVAGLRVGKAARLAGKGLSIAGAAVGLTQFTHIPALIQESINLGFDERFGKLIPGFDENAQLVGDVLQGLKVQAVGRALATKDAAAAAANFLALGIDLTNEESERIGQGLRLQRQAEAGLADEISKAKKVQLMRGIKALGGVDSLKQSGNLVLEALVGIDEDSLIKNLKTIGVDGFLESLGGALGLSGGK